MLLHYFRMKRIYGGFVMKSRINISILLIILGVLSTAFAQADYEYEYLSDLLGREHREAGDADDWIERGNATVTASPRFEDGIRLTAWGGEFNEQGDHEFAIASAVYFFEIPRQAQYVEILVRYRGEPRDAELEGQEKVVGRVWVRNTKREYASRHYDDKHAAETRYGDTFFLRAKRRSETIKIAAAGHVADGELEMHIVVEDGEQLDVEHIDVLTYKRRPDFRVVHRYARSYDWRPWHRYTYHYFYDGPFYYCTDLDYYIRWSYPFYDRRYLSIRYDFGNYLHRYYTHYPRYYYRSYSNRTHVHVHTKNRVKTHRRGFNRWSEEHETVRHQYNRSRLSRTVSGKRNSDVQKRVRGVIAKHHQESVAAGPAQRSMSAGKRQSFKRNTEFNPTTRRRSQYSRPSQVSSRSRYRPTNQQYQSQQDNRRSNNERRSRLYSRSRISRSSSSTPAARYRPAPSRTTSRSKPIPSATSRSRASSTRQSPSRTTTRNKDDDDGQSTRQSERSRNTSRTKRNSRRR